MPALLIPDAAEKLAKAVEKAAPSTLAEVVADFFPRKPAAPSPTAADLGRHVRDELAAEELVDLWNVVFPGDRHVHYNEETKAIHYNEELVGVAD